MKNIMKTAAVMFFAGLISFSFAQEKAENEHHMMTHKMKTKTDNHQHSDSVNSEGAHQHQMMMGGMHQNKMMDNKQGSDDPSVRKGEIDLNAIDKNEDGKVYQDMMDWNVISDEPGECPLCGMTLKEVTLEQAEKNLTKHDYKVKK